MRGGRSDPRRKRATEDAGEPSCGGDERFPPASEKRTDAGAKNQLGVILEGLAARAVRFRDEKRLGLYKKAKLGNVFRWKLKELGYSDGFVDQATNAIITRVAVR